MLRSIRYGEADRVLHLYTADRGRIGAIARGARRTTSKFGARLEPLTRVNLVLRSAKGDLHGISAVETVAAHSRLRLDAGCIDCATRACDAVSRLLDGPDPHPEAYNLLANLLAVLDRDRELGRPSTQVAFRLKLLVAFGLMPELRVCAVCAEPPAELRFSGSAGGLVCRGCDADSFPIGTESHEFLLQALASPLAEAPRASDKAVRQGERVVQETAEHHANIRLRPAGAR